jgi:hypothetical protein
MRPIHLASMRAAESNDVELDPVQQVLRLATEALVEPAGLADQEVLVLVGLAVLAMDPSVLVGRATVAPVLEAQVVLDTDVLVGPAPAVLAMEVPEELAMDVLEAHQGHHHHHHHPSQGAEAEEPVAQQTRL